jgi:tRNA(Ile)-lysidine synthase
LKLKLNEGIDGNAFSEKVNYDLDLGGESWQCHCRSCVVGPHVVAEVRHMAESDWLYLAKLSNCVITLDKFQQQGVLSTDRVEQIPEKISQCLEYARLSARRALFSMKSIPVAATARGGLPVLVNPQGLLLSIPVSGPFSIF